MPRASRTSASKKAPKKATPRKAAAKKAVPRKAPVKKAVARKAAVKKVAPKKAAPKKAAPKKAAPKKAAPKKAAPRKAAVKKVAPKKLAPKQPGPTKAVAAARPSPPVAKAAKAPAPRKVRGHDAKFLAEQREMLLVEHDEYERQAEAFRAEAEQLAAEMGPGDSQFDEETGGEGDAMSIERERDLAMSAQARLAIDDIDRALAKIDAGTYGICERCHQPIMKARLKALPHASLCVQCKSGGLSSRR
jgi:RNA polymerase-binding transcription factor DksA